MECLAYEQACLDETRGWLRRKAGFLPRQTVLAVEAEGSYPDTRIVVDFVSLRGEPRKHEYPLWGHEFEVAPGHRESPDQVAMFIWVSVDEVG